MHKLLTLISCFSLIHSCYAFNFNIKYHGLSCAVDISYPNLYKIVSNLFISDKNKFAALTFDDGPSITRIHKILRILNNNNAKATFFVNGYRVNRRTVKVLKKIIEAGHELGNHSWSHKNMTTLSKQEQYDELLSTCIAIKKATNANVEWFRPPYGCQDRSTISNSNKLKMDSILWTIDSQDYNGEEAEPIIVRVLAELHNGAIILFHDKERTDSLLKIHTDEALGQIVTLMKKLGYDLVTLSEWERRVCDAIADYKAKKKARTDL